MNSKTARKLRREAMMVATFTPTMGQSEKKTYKKMKKEHSQVKDAPIYKPKNDGESSISS